MKNPQDTVHSSLVRLMLGVTSSTRDLAGRSLDVNEMMGVAIGKAANAAQRRALLEDRRIVAAQLFEPAPRAEGEKMEPRKFVKMAAQGDLLIVRIEELPARITAGELKAAKPEDGRHIVAHSETGHHHWINAVAGVDYFPDPQNPMIAYLRAETDVVLTHERSFDTHAPISIGKGCYELRRQREHTPEGWRQISD